MKYIWEESDITVGDRVKDDDGNIFMIGVIHAGTEGQKQERFTLVNLKYGSCLKLTTLEGLVEILTARNLAPLPSVD